LPDWITASEAAELSGYHPEYIRRLIRRNRVYAEKKGWQWWIDRDRFREFVDDQKASEDPRCGPRLTKLPQN
jgi:excisionase family DNA binding protein